MKEQSSCFTASLDHTLDVKHMYCKAQGARHARQAHTIHICFDPSTTRPIICAVLCIFTWLYAPLAPSMQRRLLRHWPIVLCSLHLVQRRASASTPAAVRTFSQLCSIGLDGFCLLHRLHATKGSHY